MKQLKKLKRKYKHIFNKVNKIIKMPIIDLAEKFLESPYEFGSKGSQPGEKMDSSLFV